MQDETLILKPLKEPKEVNKKTLKYNNTNLTSKITVSMEIRNCFTRRRRKKQNRL